VRLLKAETETTEFLFAEDCGDFYRPLNGKRYA
jgi:hypothetical protein